MSNIFMSPTHQVLTLQFALSNLSQRILARKVALKSTIGRVKSACTLCALVLVVPVLVVVQEVDILEVIRRNNIGPELKLRVVRCLIDGVKSVAVAGKRSVGGQDAVAVAVHNLDKAQRSWILSRIGETKD